MSKIRLQGVIVVALDFDFALVEVDIATVIAVLVTVFTSKLCEYEPNL